MYTIMFGILQIFFHSNVTYNITRYLGPHPLAELIKPCIEINNDGSSRSIKSGKNKYDHPKHDYNKKHEDYIQAKVIANRT